VPLIVPEVNPDAVWDARKKNIIANPNCSTAQLVVALKPLHDAARIKRAVVSTYQSVSGTGKEGMDELWEQTKAVYMLGATEPKVYPKQIAFNLIPFIGKLTDDGYTDEEAKMWNETKKMLDPSIELTVTCVRAPVFVGHSESVNLEFETPLDPGEAREILRDSPGVVVLDKPEDKGYITPVECVGEFGVFVSRIRKDPTVENGLNLWVVSDNLRKGAALNAVQIAQLLDQQGVLTPATA
jgi:aspartate-semialdehyde dehydrogenase